MKNHLCPMLHGAAFALTLSLAACGGGGGGGGSNAAAPTVQTTIAPSNYMTVAAHAYQTPGLLASVSQLQSNLVVGASVQQPLPGAAMVAMDLLRQAGGDQAAMVTAVSGSVSCRDGGSMKVNTSSDSGRAMKAGDRIALEMSDCSVSGVRTNGSLKATVVEMDNAATASGAGRSTVSLEFAGLSFASGKQSLTIHGDVTTTLNRGSAGELNVVLTGSSLRIIFQKDGATVADRTMHAFRTVTDTKEGSSSSTSDYMLSGSASSVPDLYVAAKSLQPFVQHGTDNPVSGSMLVSGLASSVTITAVDARNVRLDFSAKGDGVITETRTIPWSEFQKTL